MPGTSFWTRVGGFFRSGAGEESDRPNPDAQVANRSAEPGEQESVEPGEVEAPARSQPALLRRRNREETLSRLEEGFDRVVGLCDSMNVHFTLQEERTAQIADSLKAVAGDMSKLADVVDRQSETLQAIVSQLETGNSRNHRLEELCEHFSKLTEAQRQSLAVVSQQVDGARQTDEQIGKSLSAFQEAVTTLGRSCTESTESLRQLRTDHAIRDEHLSGMVEQQSKRFLLLFIVTLVLAASGVVATILGAIR